VGTFRHWVWVAFCVSLLLPRTAFADRLVSADFDGDGKRDFASVDKSSSSAVRIWLSSTRGSRRVDSGRPLLQLAARDLDGDGRSELIALDGSSKLLIWKASHKKKFTRFPARRSADCSRSAPGHGFGDRTGASSSSETSDDSASAVVVLPVVFNPIEVAVPAHSSTPRAISLRRSSRSAPRGPPSA